MTIIKESFFKQSALEVAPKLLGCILVHENTEGRTAGIIIEVESYLGKNDPASHAYRGQTPRNEVMFGPPGHLYVYFTYGMHYCVNVVCAEKGVAEAVLIRALEPIDGIELMEKRRKTKNFRNLSNGPAKLTQAMGIDKKLNGVSIESNQIYLEKANNNTLEIVRTPRIGVSTSQKQPWRFYIKGKLT